MVTQYYCRIVFLQYRSIVSLQHCSIVPLQYCSIVSLRSQTIIWLENDLTVFHEKSKGKVFYGQESPSGELIYYHRTWGQLSTICSNATEVGNGELPAAVDHNQLLTMASERVDYIDWPLSLTLHRAVPSEPHVLHDANADQKSDDLLHPLGRERATIGISG